MSAVRARPLKWDIAFLATNEALRSKRFGMPREAKRVRYPIRLLRYWFGYHLLREAAAEAGRPLDVAEIGVHTGQFLEFVRTAPAPPALHRWTAIDAVVLGEKLRRAGYDDVVESNLEDPGFELPREYDAAVLLHVLEHLFEPERAVERIVRRIRTGGFLIGGFPVVPHPLVAPRQAAIRRTAAPMGHVSVFSPRRVRRMAARAGCDVAFLSGAYFLRSKGSALENSAAWLRFNLWWGARFPAWPGELYWMLRKRP